MYVNQIVPPVFEQIAEFYLAPTFFCEVELSVCKAQNYVELPVQDYVDRVLASKPDYLANDDYQN